MRIAKILVLMSSLLMIPALSLADPQPIQHCGSQDCLKAKAELEKLGYDPSIAERIVIYRPDVYRMIVSPEIQVKPEGWVETHKDSPPSQSWFNSWMSARSQDRKPVTLYRGLKVDAANFDPMYLSRAGKPEQHMSDDANYALQYAGESKKGMVVRYQLPRFLVYPDDEKDFRKSVFFRDVVPDESAFISGVHFTADGRDNKFLSFEQALPRLPKIHPTGEERISGDGKFLPTRSWADAVCADMKKKDGFFAHVSFVAPATEETYREAFWPVDRQTSRTRIESARNDLPKVIYITSPGGGTQMSFPAPSPNDRVQFDDGSDKISLVESARACLNARLMVLNQAAPTTGKTKLAFPIDPNTPLKTVNSATGRVTESQKAIADPIVKSAQGSGALSAQDLGTSNAAAAK